MAIILSIIFPFLITLFQTSFFNFSPVPLNLLLVFISIIFIWQKNDNLVFFGIIVSGFYLDVFSNFVLGTSIMALLISYFFLKLFLKNIRESNIFILIFVILLATLLFEILLPASSFVIAKIFNQRDFLKFDLGFPTLYKILANMAAGLIAVILWKAIRKINHKGN